MEKFKVGTVLKPKPYYQGIEKMTVKKIDKDYYTCDIVNGTITIPIKTVENNYTPV